MGSPVVVASPRKSPLSGRRLNKPLVEKKRRARINGCLGQLKSLILSAVQSEQGSQVSRLEKADILEMTVKYLRHVQRHQASAVATSEPEVVAKFSAGYTECATEVIRYMDSVQCVAPEVRSRLEYHLVERLRGSVPTTVTSTTSVGNNTPAIAFTGMPTHNQTSVSDVCGRLVSSTNSSIPEQIHRHYQTAVDLANMAAAVTAKEAVNPAAGAETITVLNQSQSFHRAAHSVSELSLVGAVPLGVHAAFNMVVPQRAIAVNEMYQSREGYHSTKSTDIIRSHSISPSHIQPREVLLPMVTSASSSCHVSHIRHRSEPGLSQMAYSLTTTRSANEEMNICVNNDANNYGGDKRVQNSTGSSNINEYLSSFQRPLHIHIPDSGSSRPRKPTPSPPYIPDSPSPPAPQPTPSPPFLHPHVGYPHVSGQSHPMTVASSTEYMPHTVLYGYTDYQTGVTRMHPAQYNANTIDLHTRSSNISNTDNSSRESDNSNYIDNISRESTNSIYNESVRNSTDRNMSQFVNNFTKTYVDNISNYQSDFENHPSFRHGSRTTPSPPTLLPEEAYVSDTSDQYYDNSYQDLSSQEYSPDFSANGDFRANFPAAFSPNVKENYDPQSIRSNGQMISNVQYRCNQYDQLSGYSQHRQSNLTTTSAMKQTSNFPTEQSTGNGLTDNGQDGMKRPCQAQTAPSRQNDQTLSPPTLKKRLLLAQGSAGEWTTPRYSGASEDKRQFRCDTGRVLSLEMAASNPRLWREGHESQVHGESAATLPGAAFCALPVHAVPTDESLWRPW